MIPAFVLASTWALSPVPTLGQATEIKKAGWIPLAHATERINRLRRDGFDLPAPIDGIDVYRVHYASKGSNGEPRTLSGLLLLPVSGVTKGLVIEYHGTIANRELSPSRYRGNFIDPNAKDPQPTHPEAEAVALAFTSGGYAVAMPDYLGLGDDPGVHPYPLAKLNADSGIDMANAVRAARPDLNGPLFVTGYSEGGAVAMWAVRKLEAAGIPVAAASPMSGPYDLSGVTSRSLIRGGQGLTGLGEKLYLLGYTAYSAQSRNPDLDLKNYFAPSMATYIPFLFRQNAPQGTVGRKLVIKALQMGANGSIKGVLTDRFRRALQNGDATDPLLAELKMNDTYDWAPKTKMLLPFLGNDGVVVPENTTRTLAAMRARGVGEDVVRGLQIAPRRGLGHGTAAGPALAATRRFFDGGFAGVGPEVTPAVAKVTVARRERDRLPEGATISLRLVDLTDRESPIVVAESKAPAEGGAVPIAFRLPYERARVLVIGRYELRAEILVAGATFYRGTRGFDSAETNSVELTVRRVPRR